MAELDMPDLTAPKKQSIARFFSKSVEMTFKSQQEGRPICEDRDFVEILIPGDRRSIVVEPVNEDHKQRWPREWAAYVANMELPQEGTPLRNWPNSAITPARIDELAFFNIRTVEQLAEVSDAHLANLGMGARQMREAAKTFLEVAAKGTGPLERLVAAKLHLEDELRRAHLTIAEQADTIRVLRAEKGLSDASS